MFDLLRLSFGLLVRLFHSRDSLLIENLALRQQLAVFKRKQSRPQTGSGGEVVLGRLAALLVLVEKSPHCSHARYCGPVAPCRFSALLATRFPRPQADRQKACDEGDPRVDFQNRS